MNLIAKAKAAATRGVGGADGMSYRELFDGEVYKATLDHLIANEFRKQGSA